MNFKKAIVVVASLALLSGSAWATCEGPECEGAIFGDTAGFIGGGIQADGEIGPGMITGGIGLGGGVAGAQNAGFVTDGSAGGNVDARAGGFAGVGNFGTQDVNGADTFDKTGTWTYADGETGADVHVNVDPTKRGIGAAEGTIFGKTGEASASGSGLILDNNTEGATGAIAAQGAKGEFRGSAVAASGPDVSIPVWVPTGCWGLCGYWDTYDVDSNAQAGAGAQIDVKGDTETYSQRYHEERRNSIDTRDVIEEGMESGYNANTMVTTGGYNYDDDRGLGYADATVRGEWEAKGGAASMTVQKAETPGGFGAGMATSAGAYCGEGNLNDNYMGHADGYTYSRAVTVENISGVHGASGAGSFVTSVQNTNVPN